MLENVDVPRSSSQHISECGTVDGQAVHEVSIRSQNGAKAKILTLGGIICELEIPLRNGTLQDVVLGYGSLKDYELDTAYMGAIAGRYANRIANGSYAFEGKTYLVDRNENQTTCLHGGSKGFSKRIWTVTDITDHAVTLRLSSPNGDQGFPGTLLAQCKYAFVGTSEFSIEFWANTDIASPVNLVQHAYFSLDGSSDISNHILQIFADKFTPTTPDLIPTGEIADVDGTAFDFRKGKLLKDSDQLYDCNLVLNVSKAMNKPQSAAVLRSMLNGLTMTISTTKPGLQFYDGHFLAIGNVGKRGVSYGARAGLCLETQFFPDSPNHPNFPNTILRPGSNYHHVTTLQFSQVKQT